jgi:hypothetical protein
MTISLPYVWVAGHLAAPLGAILLLFHLFKPHRLAVSTSIVGGMVSCAFLAFVLFSEGKGFVGAYRFVAWLIAFLAGYLAAAPAGYLLVLVQRSRPKQAS